MKIEEAKTCPFCGTEPQHVRTKIRYCQMHGDPYQNHLIKCVSKKCMLSPRTKDHVHLSHALEEWNQRP